MADSRIGSTPRTSATPDYGCLTTRTEIFFTTSIALLRHRERVRPDRVPGPTEAIPDFDDPEADWSLVAPTGVVGDPTRATAELGERLWARTVEQVVETVTRVAAEGIQ